MPLSTYYLEDGRHLARLHRRRRRRPRAYAPTSNTASHENHEKINSSAPALELKIVTIMVTDKLAFFSRGIVLV